VLGRRSSCRPLVEAALTSRALTAAREWPQVGSIGSWKDYEDASVARPQVLSAGNGDATVRRQVICRTRDHLSDDVRA
jgi:hypothetical protein